MLKFNRPIWAADNLKNVHQDPQKPDKVQAMFDDIAPRYDLTNKIISLNMDKKWRNKAIKTAKIDKKMKILDLCCGSGDMALALAQTEKELDITAVDFSARMLEVAKKREIDQHKDCKIKWLQANAMDLEFADADFDLAYCTFGLRNTARPEKVIDQIAGVLKSKGQLIILEFEMPKKRLLALIVRFYLRFILPLIARLASGSTCGAYDYFYHSIANFKTEETLMQALLDNGFEDIKIEKMALGTVLLIKALRK